MIRGELRRQQTSIDFRVEDSDAGTISGERIRVGAWLAPNQTLATETTQVVGHLRRGIRGGEESGYLGTQAPIGEAGHRVDGNTQCADQGHCAGIPEAQGSGSLALLKRGQCDPFKERGRNGTALSGTLNGQQTTIGGASLRLQFRQVVQAALAAEVGGRIAHGLDTQRAALFQIFLDPRVFVENVDDDVHTTCDHLGRELTVGVGVDLPAEDQLDLIGPTDVEVVGDERLEETAGTTWCVEDQGARGFDLTHRELPPVPGLSIGVIQWRRDDRHPAIEEGLEVIRPESITDRLQGGSIGTRAEAVGKFGERQSCGLRLTLGPLVGVGSGRSARLSAGSVSLIRSPEPDLRVTTHPALHRFTSLGWMTILYARPGSRDAVPPVTVTANRNLR